MIGIQSGVGVYVDSGKVYAIHLASRFGQIGLLGYAEVDFSAAAASDAANPNNTIVVDAVKSALSKAAVTSKFIATAISGHDTFVRYFDMPQIPKSDWPTAIRYEAQKYIAHNPADLYYNFNVVVDKPEKKLQVLFLAAKKETVNKTIAQFTLAGLTLRALEPTPCSLLRAFYFDKPLHDKNVHLMIDARSDGSANVLIVKNGVLLASRDTSLLRSPDSDPTGSPRPDFRALMVEVNLALDYLAKRFKEPEIKSIALLADANEVFGSWDRQLNAELGVPVETSQLSTLFGRGKGYSSGRAVAMGLALREIASSKNKSTNLLPAELLRGISRPAEKLVSEEERRAAQAMAAMTAVRPEQFRTWILANVMVVFVLIFCVQFFIQFQQKFILKDIARMQRLSQKTEHLSDPSVDMGTMLLIEGDVNAQVRYLDVMIDKRVYMTEKLAEIAKALPANFRLVSLTVTNDDSRDQPARITLRIEGKLLSSYSINAVDEISGFVTSLKKSKDFMSGLAVVKIASIRQSLDQGTDFVIECLSA